MKKLLAFALTFCLMISLSAPALAAGSGLGNFQKTDTYTGQFADVPAGHWAAPSVKLCCEYGLMKGSASNRFNLEGNLTLAEAIVMADRIHEIYTTGQSTISNGDPWYQPYVDYAVANGIIAAEGFPNYTAKATRAQMAQIFYNALPASELAPINSVASLPDVPSSAPYAAAVMALYQAGVLTGSDMYGTFHPNKNIKRSEAAAILTRMALPAQRQSVVLMKHVNQGNINFAVPQSAQADSSNGLYLLLSQDARAGALFYEVQDSNLQGVDITILSSQEMTRLLTQSFAQAGLTVGGGQSTKVTFGALPAYRTTGTLTMDGMTMDSVFFTYISGSTMTMICLVAYENDAVLTSMANGLTVGGFSPRPQM